MAGRVGEPRPDEVRKKISDGRKGKGKGPRSEDAKGKISKGMKRAYEEGRRP